MKNSSIRFVTPNTPGALDTLRGIFREYARSLQIDLCFQDFEAELAQLPGEYAPPRGALLMALAHEKLAGCCALRALDAVDYPNACEMLSLIHI